MVILPAIMFVVMAVTVSTTFWLEGALDFSKIRPEATKHIFDYMVRPYEKNVVSNFGGQMPITQVPGKAYQLNRILMCDFHEILHSCLNL
jgi:hypothetical protein